MYIAFKSPNSNTYSLIQKSINDLEKCASFLAEVLDQFKNHELFWRALWVHWKYFYFDPSCTSFGARVWTSPVQFHFKFNMMHGCFNATNDKQILGLWQLTPSKQESRPRFKTWGKKTEGHKANTILHDPIDLLEDVNPFIILVLTSCSENSIQHDNEKEGQL